MFLSNSSPTCARFHEFQVDLSSGVLERSGVRVAVQAQPLQVLRLLLQAEGKVVTREELRKVLWPEDTFVDFELGVNTAVKKLRQALADPADRPKFIETLPKIGYRFLVPVEWVTEEGQEGITPKVQGSAPSNGIGVASVPENHGRAAHVVDLERRSAVTKKWVWLAVCIAGFVLLSMAVLLRVLRGNVNNARLALKHPETPLTAVPLTTYPGIQDYAAFSPDGKLVAFTWGESKDKQDLYVTLVNSDGPPLRLTTHPAASSSPSWSPDGRYIAFIRALPRNGLAQPDIAPTEASTPLHYSPLHRAGVFLIPAIGGPERKLAESFEWFVQIGETAQYLAGNAKPALSWSPDGKWLTMKDGSSTDGQDSIYLLSVGSGEKHRLTFPPIHQGDGEPAFSPDGHKLAFSRVFTFGVSEVFVLALSDDLKPIGQPRQLTFKHLTSNHPTWTPDGREIVFASGPGSSDDVRGVPAEIWRVSASEPGEPRRVVFAGEQGLNPALSLQGHHLAYTRRLTHESVSRIDVAGQKREEGSTADLISSTGGDIAPQYSSDGARIVFISSRSGTYEVWVCNSDGSAAIQLTHLGATITGSPRWSPDGEKIVFDSNREGHFDVYETDATGGRLRRLTSGPDDAAVASWSRDGHWVYFVSNRTGRWEIWKMAAEGGDATQVTNNGGYVAFESADGKTLYYSKGLEDTSLWRRPIGGGEEIKVLKSLYGSAFVPTNKGIYFGENYPGDRSSIRLLSFKTGKITTIASVKCCLTFALSVSPDQAHVIYTRGDRRRSNLMLVDNFR